MRTLAILLSILLVFHSSQPAFADKLIYQPGGQQASGSFKGSAAVNKIGNLYGDDLSAILDGDTLTIQQDTGGRLRNVARGTIFFLKADDNRSGPALTGYWFCRAGSKFARIVGNRKGGGDVIDTKSGARLVGSIQDVSFQQVEIETKDGRKSIPVSDIGGLSSARVFRFTCPLQGVVNLDLAQAFEATAERFEFTSTFDSALAKQASETQRPEKAGGKVKSGWSTRKKIIVFTIAALLIATAIAVPIAVAVPLSNRNRGGSAFPPFPLFQPNQNINAQQPQP